MKRLIVTAACILAFVGVTAQEKVSLSLEQAIEMGLKQNFDQQIIEISTLSAQETLEQSERDRLPSVNAQLSQGISNVNGSGNYSVTASMDLWSGGVKMNTIRRSKLELEQTDEQVVQAQNTLAISIINSYLKAVMNDELYRYQESVLEISQEQAKLGEVRYKSGEILESDYLLLKAQAASDANALTKSKIDRTNATIELKNLLAIDHNTTLEVTSPDSGLTIESMPLPALNDLIDITMDWLPELKIARTSAEIAQSNIDIAKSALMPTLSLNGSVGTSYNDSFNNAWSSQFSGNNVNAITLSLSVPLWNKGKTRSNIKQANYNAQQAQIEFEKLEFEVRSQLESEYNSAISLQQSTVSAYESCKAYEETFRVFSSQFTEGAITTTELLQQQNNYLASLNGYVQSKYSYILSRKVLDVYMGVEIKL